MRQKLPTDHIKNPRSETQARLLAAGLAKRISPGARIAITAGSRGIGGFTDLIAGIVDAVKAAGGKPFIIPAMGSHGGATAEGQTALLKVLGISASTIGAPVQATMETLPLGASKSGAVAHLDKLAAEADGIIVLGRVTSHPENKAGVASGLLKMVTVGLGKQAGAQEAHSHGLWESVKAVPRLTLARNKVIFGVAVVENAFHQPVIIEVVPPSYQAFREADERLLKASEPHAAKIPFKTLDLLVVDELGKNVSGTGMDLNVVGKWRLSGGKHEPDFFRIVVLSLTEGSMGNGLGIGLADFTTKRFLNAFDAEHTYINLLTATEPDAMNTREGPLPLALDSDREAIGVGLYSALASGSPRLCRIKSTSRLDQFWVSEALLDEVKSNSNLEILSAAEMMEFDHAGNLF
ncbi:MAG TPA: lactate racemase domain-containing protein [Verrucomicrobiae bacterium]|nr:lactate racemase domain-containing protein [Verrucomicrobiae bacterium]